MYVLFTVEASGSFFWFPERLVVTTGSNKLGRASQSRPAPDMTCNLHPKHFFWALKFTVPRVYSVSFYKSSNLFSICGFISFLAPNYTHFCCLSLFLHYNQEEVIDFIGLFKALDFGLT